MSKRKSRRKYPRARPDLRCGECGALMLLRKGRDAPFYGCTRFPECRGTHGAHPDGAPLGVPANKQTKAARMRAHAAFDRLWDGGPMRRGDAYRWLTKAMGITTGQAHIGEFDEAQCEQVIALVDDWFARKHGRQQRATTYGRHQVKLSASDALDVVGDDLPDGAWMAMMEELTGQDICDIVAEIDEAIGGDD